MNNKETIEEQLIESFDKIEFLNEEDIEKLNFYEIAYYLQEVNRINNIYNAIKGEKYE